MDLHSTGDAQDINNIRFLVSWENTVSDAYMYLWGNCESSN